jgi:hypothetical protein
LTANWYDASTYVLLVPVSIVFFALCVCVHLKLTPQKEYVFLRKKNNQVEETKKRFCLVETFYFFKKFHFFYFFSYFQPASVIPTEELVGCLTQAIVKYGVRVQNRDKIAGLIPHKYPVSF